jgi:hypothetical protein
MTRANRINGLVTLVTLSALLTVGVQWQYRMPFPGWWAFSVFLVVAAILDGVSTRLRIAAKGTTSFVAHLAAALLFGGFWGATIAGASTLAAELFGRKGGPIKGLFNVSQRVLAVSVSVLVYTSLGGDLPPAYLGPDAVMSSVLVQRDLGLFFVLAAVYFTVNSVAVSAAISLSSERTFREVWALNTSGVLGYDLGASTLGILLAWLYVRFDQWIGFGPGGLVFVIVPIVAVRHIYGMYRQLQESGQELLQLMVKAIEARDPYAALLHDVGKIHEEFAPLLRKAEKLTEAEFALLQTHSAKGAELVHIISSFRGKIEAMVRNHHERWDGDGYPDGLAGEEIPLGSRIIMVSDTIDAMTTDRPYRKALGVDVVMAELQRCKGTQFDARLVDVVASSVAIRRIIAEATDLPEEAVAAPSAPGRSRRIRLSGGESFLSG